MVLLGAWAVVWLTGSGADNWGGALPGVFAQCCDQSAAINGRFNLVDSAGRAVTDESFRGKWMLIYFGYTYSPAVTPAVLQKITDMLDTLGDKAAQIVPLFITVDPDRDTPAAIGQYVALFDPRLIGLTGATAQVAAAEASYRVFSRRTGGDHGNSYAIEYTSSIYLMAPDGKLKMVIDADTDPAELGAMVINAMSGRG